MNPVATAPGSDPSPYLGVFCIWEAKMMWKDEIVEEVRRARDEYAAKFNYDIAAMCADIRRRQQLNGRNVVKQSPLLNNQADTAEQSKELSAD